MNFGEIINHSRTRCRDRLLAAVQECRGRDDEIIIEPAPRDSSGNIVSAPDGLMLPLRYDLAYREAGGDYQTQYAETVTIRFSEPVFATWERRLRIEIHSIAWDCLRFHCTSAAGITDYEPLRAWFLNWFDIADELSPDDDGLHGVVHILSDPESADQVTTFVVDLGSASSDALAELFDVLLSLGVTHCILGETDATT